MAILFLKDKGYMTIPGGFKRRRFKRRKTAVVLRNSGASNVKNAPDPLGFFLWCSGFFVFLNLLKKKQNEKKTFSFGNRIEPQDHSKSSTNDFSEGKYRSE